MEADLPRLEWVCSDVTVLASEITGLASLRLGRITRGHLATNVWILVSKSGGTIAIRWDWLIVDVVH